MTLTNAMTLYLVSCESSCAERTIFGYRDALVMFFDWLESEKERRIILLTNLQILC